MTRYYLKLFKKDFFFFEISETLKLFMFVALNCRVLCK